jgi:phospholipase D1/2
MSTTAPQDGATNPEHLKDKLNPEHLMDKLKHPFPGLREKLRDTKLYDLKVALINKK